MLSTITLDSNTSVESLASRFKGCWDESGVVHIKGRQFKDESALRAFYDEFIENVGTPAAVGEDATAVERTAQRTGQRWTEIRYDPKIPDAYRHSANPQPLHTDGSYVPDFPDAAIIYCQQATPSGGETVFLSSDELLGALAEEAPDLLADLQRDILPHSRSGTAKTARVIESDDLGVKLSWNYYCVAEDITSEQKALRQRFFDFLESSDSIKAALVPVALKPGECVIWKDERVLHGRNGFDPSRPSERFLWKGAFASEAA